jgi:hypothetical protein
MDVIFEFEWFRRYRPTTSGAAASEGGDAIFDKQNEQFRFGAVPAPLRRRQGPSFP